MARWHEKGRPLMSNLRRVNDYILWDEGQRRFLPVYWRREILPKWLMFDTSDVIGPYTLTAAPVPSPPVGFKQPYWSVEGLDANMGTPFEVRSLVFADSSATGTAAADFTVRMKDQGSVREFMNRPVHIRTLAGVAQTPALLREPYFFQSQQNISCFFSMIGAPPQAVVRMYLIGAEYFPWSPEFIKRGVAKKTISRVIHRWMERKKYVCPYWLTTDEPTVLTANQTADFFLKVGDDGHFQAFTISAVSTGNFAWELSEAKTHQTISNGLATQTNALGNANFPTLLPTEYTLWSGYRLRLRLRDLTGAPNTIWFTIAGRKVYAPKRDVQDVLRQTAVPTPADTPTQIVPPPLVREQPLVKA